MSVCESGFSEICAMNFGQRAMHRTYLRCRLSVHSCAQYVESHAQDQVGKKNEEMRAKSGNAEE